jgi:hypothetical protein
MFNRVFLGLEPNLSHLKRSVHHMGEKLNILLSSSVLVAFKYFLQKGRVFLEILLCVTDRNILFAPRLSKEAWLYILNLLRYNLP